MNLLRCGLGLRLDGADSEPREGAMRTRKPPRPTTLTWCAQCGRAGLRREQDALDEACRYCGGEVMRKRFPTLTQARAACAVMHAARDKALREAAEARRLAGGSS